jgi:hypothetical protein
MVPTTEGLQWESEGKEFDGEGRAATTDRNVF